MEDVTASQSNPSVSSNGQGEAPPTDPITWAIFCAGFHPDDVLDGTAAKKWEEWGEFSRRRFRRCGRAALQALREPTDAMLTAFASATINQWATTAGSKRGFSAMIDAAMQEMKP